MFHFIIGFGILVAIFGIWPHVAVGLIKLGLMAGAVVGIIGGILLALQLNHVI